MKLSIGIVSYNNTKGLQKLMTSMSHLQNRNSRLIDVFVYDNSDDVGIKSDVRAKVDKAHFNGLNFKYIESTHNLGFGTAVNRINEILGDPSDSDDWLLVLNQDVELTENVLSQLFDLLPVLSKDTGAVELRQLPFEHPKIYNPSTQLTAWISGAAFAVRRQAFQAVGGFDERLFLYAEDVDLSWRLRANGYQLRYLPQVAVYHHTVEVANQVKPVQVTEGTLNNLCLRARYGGIKAVAVGLIQLFFEVLRKPNFPGRRLALLMIYPRFAKRFWPFYSSGRLYRQKAFDATFMGWNFALHRRGAYHPSSPEVISANKELPLVSILIRTQNRPFYLREAILSALNQTYPKIEVVVVEDGEGLSKPVIEELADNRVCYHAIGHQSGRSNAGNVALSIAKGQWFNFLDDDDQLYADHVETLMSTIMSAEKPIKAAYGATFEVMTEYQTDSYIETSYYQRYAEPFSVFTLLKHNFLPIQSVLFSRQLFDQHGGFNTELDMLEDWNLWLKYGLNAPFQFVDKTTSKYRVPAMVEVAANRKAGFQEAFAAVVEDQQKFAPLLISVKDAQQMLDVYLSSKRQMESQERRIKALTSSRRLQRLFYRAYYFGKGAIRHWRK